MKISYEFDLTRDFVLRAILDEYREKSRMFTML